VISRDYPLLFIRDQQGLNKSYQNQNIIREFSCSPRLRYSDCGDDILDPFPELQPGLFPGDQGPVDNDGHILMEMRRGIEKIKPDFNQT
jgi:hypothetical protein